MSTIAGIFSLPPPAGMARNAGSPPAQRMFFDTISATNNPLKTGRERRGNLAAYGGVIERRADHLQPFGGAVVSDQRIEHAVRLGEDTGLVERMLRIADRLDDALLVDFAVVLDVHFGRLMLQIVGFEPHVGRDLYFGSEPRHVGIRLRRTAVD